MLRVLLSCVFFLASIIVFNQNIHSKPLMNDDIILAQYSNLENALNTPSVSLEGMNFLHHFIEDDATFTVGFRDADNRVFENISVDKAQFINSFLESKPLMNSYTANIDNITVASEESDEITVNHQITETGVI